MMFTRAEFPGIEQKRRAVIITGRCEGGVAAAYEREPGDFVMCADAGLALAQEAGVREDAVLGDFDSLREPKTSAPLLRVPAEKDDTDTLLAVKQALALGFSEMLIIGGTGGRLDHTLANIAALAYALGQGARAVLTDGRNTAELLCPGEYALKKREGYLSLLPYGGDCGGVSISGVKYPLSGAALRADYPLGVSNRFLEETVKLSFSSGLLLVIYALEPEQTGGVVV